MINDLCFEIIQTCPNHCLFCSSNAGMNATHVNEYELFTRVIDHIVLHGGLKELSISGGEPFLHQELFPMVKYAKSHGINTNVYTSGIIPNPLKNLEIDERFSWGEQRILNACKKRAFSFIPKETLREFKDAGLDKIVFDFQSHKTDNYNELMGSKNNITHLFQSIIFAKSVGLFTEVHFIPMKLNVDEIEDILEICDIAKVDRISLLKFVPQGRGKVNKDNLQLDNNQLQAFCQKIETLRKKYKVDIRLGIPLTQKNTHRCTAGRDKLSIRYDGMVLPCVAFKELDTQHIKTLFQQNHLSFTPFSIKDNLDNLLSKEGSNPFPICKQIYF